MSTEIRRDMYALCEAFDHNAGKLYLEIFISNIELEDTPVVV